MKHNIRITCEGSELVPLSRLIAFQGNLKTLSDDDFEKFRADIEEYGFSFPIGVWKHGTKRNIIDGHQRLATVQRMLEDGWALPGGKLPVYAVHARNEKEAKAKVLLAASQFGRYTADSVSDFIKDAGLDWGELKLQVDLPMIDGKSLDALLGLDLDGQTKEEKAKTISEKLEFKILVLCTSERHQRELLKEFEKRKLECQALMF